MKDPQVLAAVAASVSALTAVAALVLSIIGLVRSNSASKDAVGAKENAASAQWKMNEYLQTIAEAQAEAAKQLARGGTPSNHRPGKLSARLVRSGLGRGHRLIVANVGTEPLMIDGIDVQSADILAHGATADFVGAELEPGEDVSIPAALDFETRLPLDVTLRWRGSSGEPHQRTQRVPLS